MGPLSDIIVLDFSRFQAGPFCGMLIADMGAEVIRIEEPGGAVDRQWGQLGPDGETLSFKITGKNKKGITLALGSEKGRGLLAELIKHSDVILHSFSPGSPFSKSLQYDVLKELNRRIIVAAISGYGQTGPDSNEVCFDAVAQARAGGMLVTGFPFQPPLKTSITYVDFSAGLSAALGILLALHHREKTGMGQGVDVALFDTAFLANQVLGVLSLYQIYGEVRSQVANRGFHSYIGCFEAKDGWVMIAPATDHIWRRFTKAIGRLEMSFDSRFSNDMDRFRNAELIDLAVKEWLNGRTVNEILGIMRRARVPSSAVNTIDCLVNDPQVKAREMFMMVDHEDLGKLPLPGTHIKLSNSPGAFRSVAPKVGQNNEEIYSRLLKLNKGEILQLKKEGVI